MLNLYLTSSLAGKLVFLSVSAAVARAGGSGDTATARTCLQADSTGHKLPSVKDGCVGWRGEGCRSV